MLLGCSHGQPYIQRTWPRAALGAACKTARCPSAAAETVQGARGKQAKPRTASFCMPCVSARAPLSCRCCAYTSSAPLHSTGSTVLQHSAHTNTAGRSSARCISGAATGTHPAAAAGSARRGNKHAHTRPAHGSTRGTPLVAFIVHRADTAATHNTLHWQCRAAGSWCHALKRHINTCRRGGGRQ
jgi:hypothetical protein